MSRLTPHPDLAAFVAHAGKDETVARHLRECEACRDEVADLQALRTTLRAAGDHLTVEALVEQEAGHAVSAHLAVCPECRADLEALRRSRHALESDRFVRPGARRRWLLPAVAAAASVVVAGGWVWLRVQEAPAALVLLPPHRGSVEAPHLIAGRTIALRIALPFGASSGAYEARVESVDGGPAQPLDVSVAAPGEMLAASLEVPRRPGSYRIVVRPAGDPRAAPIAYPFVVE